MHNEVEIKFRVADLADLTRRLRAAKTDAERAWWQEVIGASAL